MHTFRTAILWRLVSFRDKDEFGLIIFSTWHMATSINCGECLTLFLMKILNLKKKSKNNNKQVLKPRQGTGEIQRLWIK